MNSKRMLNSDVMFSNAVASCSDKAFRLYLNTMLFADDDGFVSSLANAKLVSGAGEQEVEELVNCNLIGKFDDGNVLIMDWLRHNNISKRCYRNLCPSEVRQSIKVEPNGRYTLNEATAEAVSIDDYRFAKSNTKAKK